MKVMAKTKYINEPATLHFGKYADGSTAIQLVAADGSGEPLAKATVCIAEYAYTPPPGHVVVKDYSENAGMLNCLVNQGVVAEPVVWIDGPNGINFPVCELVGEAKSLAA